MRLCGPLMMAMGLVVGLALPSLSAFMAPSLGPMMAGILFLTILRTDMAIVGGYLRRPGLPLLALGGAFIVSPVMMAGLAMLPLPDAWRTCLLLNSGTPPILGAPAAAMVLGLNMELAVISMVVGTVLAPVTIIVATWLVPAGGLHADPLVILARVSLYTVLPVGLGILARQGLGPRRLDRLGHYLPCAIVWGLSIVAIGLMDGANRSIAKGWDVTLPILFLALAFNLGHQALFYAVGRLLGLGLKNAGIIAILGGNRNLGMTQAGLAGGEGEAFAAYVALGQFPIYLTPMLWRSLMNWFKKV